MVRFTAELVLHGQHYHHVQCAEKIKIKLIEQRTVEHLITDDYSQFWHFTCNVIGIHRQNKTSVNKHVFRSLKYKMYMPVWTPYISMSIF